MWTAPRPPRKTSITEPLRALRHRALAIMSITALGYNWGFFTLLAYTPFPMHLGVHKLGYVFTGWGIMVAIFAIFVAPRAQARFGTAASRAQAVPASRAQAVPAGEPAP